VKGRKEATMQFKRLLRMLSMAIEASRAPLTVVKKGKGRC